MSARQAEAVSLCAQPQRDENVLLCALAKKEGDEGGGGMHRNQEQRVGGGLSKASLWLSRAMCVCMCAGV